MNLHELHQKYINIVRFQEIAYKVVKFGFSDLLDRLNIDVITFGIAKRVGLISEELIEYSRPRRFRMLLEDLGPTFVKLGQILSTREELLPQAYVEELRILQEHVTPSPQEDVRRVLLDFYRVKSETEIFAEFNFEPIATASISQVCRARLRDESRTEVVVKIQKPRMQEIVENDVRVLSYIAELIEEHFFERQSSAKWSLFFERFVQEIVAELDFSREVFSMERFTRMFEDNPSIKIPRVYPELSGNMVLVQEYIDGLKISELPELAAKYNIDLEETGKILMKSYFQQVFSEGFFHGDPHPGNLRVMTDGRLVFLDFGLVGQIEPGMMTQLSRIFWGVAREDFGLVSRSISIICRGTVSGVSDRLVYDVRSFVQSYRHRPVNQMEMGSFLKGLNKLADANEFLLPPRMSLLIKSLATLEQVVRQLSPHIRIMDFLLPQIEAMIEQRFSLDHLKRKIRTDFLLYYDYLSELPEDMFRILKNIQKMQEESSRFRNEKLAFYLLRFEKTLHRAILGVVVSSFMLGSSILLALNRSNDRLIYFLGATGYIVGGVFALMLIHNIVKKRLRHKD